MITTGIEFLSESLFTAVLYLVAYSLFRLEDAVYIPGLILVLLVQGACFLLRKRAGRIVVFLLGVIAVTGGGIWFNQSVSYLSATMAVTSIVAVYSVVMRCVPSMRGSTAPQILQLALMIILYVVLDIKQDQVTAFPVFWCTFCYLLLFLYATVDTNMEFFLEAREKTTVMDKKAIRRANKEVTVSYVVIAGIGMLVMALFSYRGIYTYIYRFLRWLFSGISGGTEAKEEMLPMTNEPIQTPFLLQEKPKKEWPWMKYMEKAVYVLAFAVLVALIVAFFYTIWRVLYQGFYKSRKSDTKKVLETTETRERLQRVVKKKKGYKMGGDPRIRVRRLYRKQMNGFWRNATINKEAATPEEQRRCKDDSLDQAVVEVYEKARYSEEEITKEEVAKLKRLLRGKENKN